MREVRFSNCNGYFIVDDEDYDFVSMMKFRYENGYPTTSIDGKNVRVHTLLFPNVDGMETDHKNGNTLDNRKSNFRHATHLQNIRNQRLRSDNTTGYKGVCWDKRNKKYHVTIRFNGKKIFLGRYTNVIDAAKAYDDGARFYFGEFAKTNF